MNTLLRCLATAALLPLAFACATTEREAANTNKDPRTTYVPPAPGARNHLNSQTVLNTVRTTHAFSNPKTRDNFTLQLRGARILTGQVHFIVTSPAGDTLRHEVMPARALLSEQSDARPSTTRDQEIAILRGMNVFFAASHFSQPAVAAKEEQPAEVDAAVWQALRADPTAVAFDFPGPDGSERRLTYVRKLRKAVVLSQ
ncbi:hypothetical protein ACFQ48_17955 [Hymenobacter caeli]|uniref:FTP domain-containing protein n=1 Tax=Hymenobacter caeli TaxID=2735894 RepID=A0ABX2FUP5_9BACT|nr:hypothetical protein [Hymenobacter caeli]NRT20908.1 hypothetical protein [Hymenobacter caeli]